MTDTDALSDALRWTVAPDHPAFAGHFPGTPILPGVMLLDAALQGIAAVTGIALDTCDISVVKFLSPVHPGDLLTTRHTIAAGGMIRFEITAGTRPVASGSIVPRPAS